MTTGSTSTIDVVEQVGGYNLRLLRTRHWFGGDAATYTRVQAIRKSRIIPARVLFDGTIFPEREVVWYEKQPPRRRSKMPNNGYESVVTRTRESFWQDGAASGYIGGDIVVDPSDYLWTSEDDYALIGKIHEEIAGSSFNAGVFLGESKMSIKLIGDTVTRISGALRNFKRGRYERGWHYLTRDLNRPNPLKGSKMSKRDLSSQYLQVEYGIKPLLSDVEAAARSAAYLQSAPTVYRFAKTRYARGKPAGTVGERDEGMQWWVRFYTTRHVQHSKRIIAYVSAVDYPELLGLKDPTQVMWELTPYSFVADWFIPVGKWLEATATNRAIRATYVTSEKHLVRDTLSRCVPVPNVSPDKFFRERFTFKRSVSDALPVPSLNSFREPEKSFTLSHAINSVALLVQRFGSR